jgi:hypothetical protein
MLSKHSTISFILSPRNSSQSSLLPVVSLTQGFFDQVHWAWFFLTHFLAPDFANPQWHFLLRARQTVPISGFACPPVSFATTVTVSSIVQAVECLSSKLWTCKSSTLPLSHTSEVPETGEGTFTEVKRQSLSLLQKMPGTVVCPCNPSYLGGRGRRMASSRTASVKLARLHLNQ